MSGGGGSKETTNTENKTQIPEYMKEYMTGALADAQKLYSAGGLAPKMTRSAETLKANQMALDLSDYLQGTALPGYEKSINDLRNKSIVNSDVTRNAIDAAARPVMNNLARYAIPSTQDAAISAGQRGSSRQGIAEGLARSDANNQILDMGSRISQAAMSEELANQRLATQLMPQLLQMYSLPAQLVQGVGQANDQFQYQNDSAAGQNLMQYAQLLKMFTPQMDSTQNTVKETKQTGGMAGLGGIMGGLGGLGEMMGSLAPIASMIPGWGTAIGAGLSLGSSVLGGGKKG